MHRRKTYPRFLKQIVTRLKVPSFVPMWDEEQSKGDGKCQTRRCLSQPTSRWQKINRTKVSKPGDRRQWKRERKCWVLLFRKFWSDSLWWSAFPKVSKNWVMVECCCAGVAPVVSVQTPIRPALLFPPLPFPRLFILKQHPQARVSVRNTCILKWTIHFTFHDEQPYNNMIKKWLKWNSDLLMEQVSNKDRNWAILFQRKSKYAKHWHC